MNPERWQKIKGLFEAAQELEPKKRARFLDSACGDDAELRSEVEKLLESFDDAESFMEAPAAAEVASMFEEKKTLISSHTTKNESNGKLIAGTILANRYRIIGMLGKGGMGEVFKAEDIKLNQTVALKFLPDKLEKDRAALERFHAEVRTARQVSHPNVCRVFDIGEVENRHFLSMEFIDGDDLSSLPIIKCAWSFYYGAETAWSLIPIAAINLLICNLVIFFAYWRIYKTDNYTHLKRV